MSSMSFTGHEGELLTLGGRRRRLAGLGTVLGQADGGGDGMQVLVGEPVAVASELAGKGPLADPFAAGRGRLVDGGRVVQEIPAP